MIDKHSVNRVLLHFAGKAKYLVPPQELFSKVKGETFIFFDTETTGLYANAVQVTELAAMAVRGDDFEVIDQMHGKIKLSEKTKAKAKCEIKVREQMTARGEKLFGIDECLKLQGYDPNDPELHEEQEVLNEFYKFCEKHEAVLVAQNAQFDLSMVNSKIDKKVPNKGVLDTKLFMRFYIIPALQTLKEKGDAKAEEVLKLITRKDKVHSTLGDILKSFGIDIKGWHGAFADVQSTIEAFKNIVQYFEQHPEVHKEERFKQEQAKAFREEREQIEKEKIKRKEFYKAEKKREPK
jgi:DNA polymerase III alpha subunit (gram-positive type)